MKPQGTIYQKQKSPRRGEVRIALSVIEKFAYRMLRAFGAGMVSFAVMIFIVTFGPIIREEFNYYVKGEARDYKASRFEVLLDFAEAEETVKVQEEAKFYGVDPYFSLVIPKIDAKSNVIANVNASVEEEYKQALKQGIAHARGTYFPGQGKNIYLFSHSTDSSINVARYNAVFYLLKKLDEGDEVIVFFADKKYEYVVTEKLVVSSGDTKWLNEAGTKERLILQTCDPPGTTWKRLLVIAEPKSN
jgi:LPXTG-site transpeptidase (sortase) family protein